MSTLCFIWNDYTVKLTDSAEVGKTYILLPGQTCNRINRIEKKNSRHQIFSRSALQFDTSLLSGQETTGGISRSGNLQQKSNI